MPDHPASLGGKCSAHFERLRELFAAKLGSGEDLGASLALTIDGEMVVDLWGGWGDQPQASGRTRWMDRNQASGFRPTANCGLPSCGRYAAHRGVRDINDRFAMARVNRVPIPANELPQIHEELKRHGAALKQAPQQAVAVYGRLKSAGYGTPELDAGAQKIAVAKVSTGG